MPSKRKLYMPKEHGSWGMFFIPLLLGFLVAGFGSWTGILFILSASGLFLLREPFLTFWRLWRRAQPVTPDLAAVVASYTALATVPGAALAVIRPVFLPLGAAAAAALIANAELVMRGKGRATETEVAAILVSVLTAPAAFYAVTGNWNLTAWTLWALAALYFASSVFYVKLRVQTAHPRAGVSTRSIRLHCAVYHAATTLVLTAAVLMDQLPALAAAAFIPVLLRALWAVVRLPSTLNLKRVGWTEVLFSLIFLALVAGGL